MKLVTTDYITGNTVSVRYATSNIMDSASEIMAYGTEVKFI